MVQGQIVDGKCASPRRELIEGCKVIEGFKVTEGRMVGSKAEKRKRYRERSELKKKLLKREQNDIP